MEKLGFIFWEITKVLVLIFLGLVSVKAVGALKARDGSGGAKWLAPLRYFLYALILALVVCGASIAGYDFAAESYYWVSGGNLAYLQFDKAYSNALRSVELRPGILKYWQQLSQTLVRAHQYASAMQDESQIKQLTGGIMPEDDTMRVAASNLMLGHYDQAIAITGDLIRTHPTFPIPYVLRGEAYISMKDYAGAEKTFLQVLQYVPNMAPAVEGLAHAYFLSGETSRCLAVLDATKKYSFSPEQRQRFQELKELYGQ